MATSILDLFSCSYAKGICYEIFTSNLGMQRMMGEPHPKFASRVMSQRFFRFSELFCYDGNFAVTQKLFVDKFSKIRERIDFWGKAHSQNKKAFLGKFNTETWGKLDIDLKNKHRLFDCEACIADQEVKSLCSNYPLKSIVERQRAEEKGWIEKKVKEAAPNVCKKKQPNKVRAIKRKMKKEIESKKKNSCVERTFGNFVSLNQRKKMRIQESFETISECKIRTEKKNEAINSGLKKKHAHVCNIKWNLDDCINEVANFSEGSYINFSALARKYNVTNADGTYNKQGGQIIREALERAGIDLNRFEYHSKSTTPRLRRQLLRLSNDTTMPQEPTEEKVMEKLNEKIDQGIYTMGEEIVPQMFKKLSIVNGSSVITEESVSGRKHSLMYLRKELLKKHSGYYRQFSDVEYSEMSSEMVISELKRINEYQNLDRYSLSEQKDKLKCFQRTRNLALWHDTSTIAGHSYLLMMVKCLYDPAIFYTDMEYKEKYGKEIKVQVDVEKPLIYIIGRCAPTDDQLKYSNTRLEDLHDLKYHLSTEKGELKDVMRFYHGDAPASSLEIGHQKGGNYFCWDCGIYKDQSSCIRQTFYCSSMDIASRIDILSATGRSHEMLQAGKLKMFENINKAEICDELHQRNVKFSMTQTKEVLLKKLQDEIKGIQNAPPLLIPNMDNGHLCESYEVLANEPMHDIAGHWRNLFEEIPFHLNSHEKILFNDICSATLKDAKRCVDYRLAFINICIHMKGKLPRNIYDIFLTGCEMQEILYAPDNERSMRNILRYCLKSYQHAILIKEIGLNLMKLRSRRIFGKYYHALVRHAGKQLRIVSGKSTHVEQEERQFNYLKNVTKLTTNNHPSNITFNLWIRYQAKCILDENSHTYESDSSIIKKFNSLLPAKSNTIIDFSHIWSNPREWQAFLETMIPDYLVEKGVWWKEVDEGIEFLDHSGDVSSQLKTQHFRSTTICGVERYLSETWKILEKSHIPAKEIIEGENDQIRTKLETLNYFQISTNQNTGNTEFEDSFIKEKTNDMEIDDPLEDAVDFLVSGSTLDCVPGTSKDCGEKEYQTSLDDNDGDKVKDVEAFVPHEVIDAEHDNIYHLEPITTVDEPNQKYQTKTAKLLERVCGDSVLVREFDSKRRKLKLFPNSAMYRADYRKIIASVEIHIVNKYNDSKQKIKSLEREALRKSSGMNVSLDKSSEYNDLVKELKILQIIRTELQF